MIGIDYSLSEKERTNFIASNPNSYVTYMTLGQYYLHLENLSLARSFFETALTKDIASLEEKQKIKDLLDECDQ
jgi:Tfp pilus assembly protein PilF